MKRRTKSKNILQRVPLINQNFDKAKALILTNSTTRTLIKSIMGKPQKKEETQKISKNTSTWEEQAGQHTQEGKKTRTMQDS